MISFEFKRKIFVISQMCFTTFSDCNGVKCDVINMHSSDTSDLSGGKAYSKLQNTLENDLSLEEAFLLSKIKKNCRYEIRRSEKEEAVHKIYNQKDILESNIIDDFQLTYNKMFADKNVPGYQFNYRLIEEGAKSGNIVISTCCPKDNPSLVIYHAYLCDTKRTMLLYSASPLWSDGDKNTANLIGRINKYSHWRDIQYFKYQGFEYYEWGGIHSIDNPNGIDRFKMEFGGDIKGYYNYTIPQSIIGRLYVVLVKRQEKIHKKHLDSKKNTL